MKKKDFLEEEENKEKVKKKKRYIVVQVQQGIIEVMISCLSEGSTKEVIMSFCKDS